MKRTNSPPLSKTGEGRGGGDRDSANKLADALGDLPLALEQAGAYIEACESSLAEYLALFSARRLELLKDFKPLDYPDTVATTWNLAFEQIARDAPAAELFNLCAFFAPDDIPLDIVVGAQHVGAHGRAPLLVAPLPNDTDTLNRALATLLRFSLVTKNDDATISIHRLVQAVTRDRMTDDERKRFAETGLLILDAACQFETDDTRTWLAFERILSHVLTISTYSDALGANPESTSFLLHKAAAYFWKRAQFDQAKRLFERVLALDAAQYGKGHIYVAMATNNIGMMLQEQGDFIGAKARFEDALKLVETNYPPNHPYLATCVNNLGGVLQALGDLNAARQSFERALKIDEAAFGPTHPNVAIRVNNLGGVLQALGDLTGARTAFERALKIDEAAFGPNHPEVATDVNNLGGVLRALGDLHAARTQFERALEILSQFLPADHPHIKLVRGNLEALG